MGSNINIGDLVPGTENFTLAPYGENASLSINYGENQLSIESTLNEDGSETLA